MTINCENIKDISTCRLQTFIEAIQEELDKREIDACQQEHENLYLAIEKFQATEYNSVLITDDGVSIQIKDISEIYNNQLDCGFAFGIGRVD